MKAPALTALHRALLLAGALSLASQTLGREASVAGASLDPFTEAGRRLEEGDAAAAAALYATVAEAEGATERGMQARYRRAQALALQPGRTVEAIAQFRLFLEQDQTLAPPRLLEVAKQSLARLSSLQQDAHGWESLETLRQQLRHLTYPARVARLEQLLERQVSAPVQRAAFQMRVEEAWWASDWDGVIKTLEREERTLGVLGEAWQGVMQQAKREKRRIVLAAAASFGVGLALVAALARLGRVRRRGHLPDWRSFRPMGLLLLHWWLTLGILYAFYWLGRRPGDVGPVVAERMAVLALLTSGSIGLAWWLGASDAMRLRSGRQGQVESMRVRGWIRWGTKAGLALLLHLCVIYLFCYHYDYASVLGL